MPGRKLYLSWYHLASSSSSRQDDLHGSRLARHQTAVTGLPVKASAALCNEQTLTSNAPEPSSSRVTLPVSTLPALWFGSVASTHSFIASDTMLFGNHATGSPIPSFPKANMLYEYLSRAGALSESLHENARATFPFSTDFRNSIPLSKIFLENITYFMVQYY